MKTFSKNQIRIIGLMIFIIILLLVLYLKKTFSKPDKSILDSDFEEKFGEGNDNKCGNVSLIRTQYGPNKPFSKKTPDEYIYLIEDVQPFEPPGFLNRREEENYTDTILEIKQSRNYIWCLNEGRNRLVISPNNNLNKKKFRDVFTSELEKNDEIDDSYYITAFGVHKSYCSNEEWCAVFLRNIYISGPNRLIFFKPSSFKENKLDMYNKQSGNGKKDIIIKDFNRDDKINLEGNIIIKKESDNTYNLYCINYNLEDNFNGEIKALIVNVNDTQINSSSEFQNEKNQTFSHDLINLNFNDTEIQISIKIIERIKDLLKESYPKIDDVRIKSSDLYIEIEKLIDFLNDRQKIIIKNIIKSKLFDNDNEEVNTFLFNKYTTDNWKKKFRDISQTRFDKVLTKFLNKLINELLAYKITYGYLDLFENDSKLYALRFNSDDNPRKFKFETISIEENNKKFNLQELVSENDSNPDLVAYTSINSAISNDIFLIQKKKKKFKKNIINNSFSPSEIKFLRTDVLNPYKIPDLSISHQLSDGSIDIYNNVVGILNYNKQDQQEDLIKEANLFHKRDVIFTVYVKVEREEGSQQGEFYAIYNNINIIETDTMIIPGIKYNYEEGGKSSLLSFFKQNENPEEKGKFKGYYDWIYLFDNLRNEGFYDFSDPLKYNNQILSIQDSFKNNPELSGENSYRFTNKHKKILEKDLKNVYDSESSTIDSYLNFHIKDGSQDVNLFFDFDEQIDDTDIDTDNICKKKKVLGIEKKADKKFKDVKNYSEFSLNSMLESEFESKSETETENYKFKQEKINSFDDFAKLVYQEDLDDEKLFDRQRLRGLLELDEKYVDFDYILKLKEIRKNVPQYQLKLLDQVISQKEKIAQKYTIKQKIFDNDGNLINNGEEKLINKLGYPFYVFYTERDYYGNPCSLEEKEKQKIFLTNRITEEMINTNKIEKEYPFIKQEFLSFTGYGNMIQFYKKKFGGSTEIETPNLCSQEDVSVIDECNTGVGDESLACTKKKLTEVYLDGTAKCEINDPSVKRKGETSSEVLLLKSIDVNACNIYMMKGSTKQYFKLGKIFGMNGEVKYQREKQFTIQTENDDYLVYRDDIIKKVYENPNSGGEINDEFIFLLTIDTDIYGIYFLFSPKLSPKMFLTRRVNIFDNIIEKSEDEEFTLEARLFDKDIITKVPHLRNKLQQEEYKKDIDYYSQKFIVPMSLATNISSEDGISIDAIDKELEKKRKEQQIQSSFFPGIVEGTSDNMEISFEEEVGMIERNLAHLNKYLGDLNKLPPEQVESIPNLLDNFKFIEKEAKNARKLMIERLENIKFITRVSDTALNQESIYNVSGPVKISNNNNNSNNTDMGSKFSEFQVQESANSINKMKKQFNSKQKYQPKCYQLEGFSNIPEHYKDRTSENNNNLVDKYYDYINSELSEKEVNLNKSTEDIANILNNLKAISDVANNNTNKNKIKLSQEVDLKNKVDRDVFKVKEYTQEEKVNNMNAKINEIKQIKDEIDRKEQKCKLPVNKRPFNYHSIISREDASLLNTYRLKEHERDRNNENKLSKELDKNIIFVNGGCLSYDEESGKLKSEHCMIGEQKQTFNIHRLEDEDDVKRYKLKNPQNEIYKYDRTNNKKILERPFYIISKLNEDENSDDETCDGQLDKNKCLHNENGNLSLRNCENIINQKWEYSTISGPCK